MPVAEGEGEKEPGGKVGRAVLETRVANAEADTEAVEVGSDRVAQGDGEVEGLPMESDAVADGEGAPLALRGVAEGMPLAEGGALPLVHHEGAALALAMEREAHSVAVGDTVAEDVARGLSLGAPEVLGAGVVLSEVRGVRERLGDTEGEDDAAGEVVSDAEREGEPVAETERVNADSDGEAEVEGQPVSEGCEVGAPETEEEGVTVPSLVAERAALPLSALAVPLTDKVRFAERVGVGATEALAIDREAERVGADTERRAVSVAFSVMEGLLRGVREAVGEIEVREEADFEAGPEATAAALPVAAPLGDPVCTVLRERDDCAEDVMAALCDWEPVSVGEREGGASEAVAASEEDADEEAIDALGCEDFEMREGVGVPLPPEEERVAAADREAPAPGERVGGMLLVGVCAALLEVDTEDEFDAAGLREGRGQGEDVALLLGEPL